MNIVFDSVREIGAEGQVTGENGGDHVHKMEEAAAPTHIAHFASNAICELTAAKFTPCVKPVL